MRSFAQLLASAVILAGLAMLSVPAHAQATRTWVSGVGDDANPCSRTAPCKTFAGAISKTAAAGIINCLDPGGFGAVTITKSITIDCTGTFAGVLAPGTNGINVNAGPADSVTLRGLSIEGAGSGLIGVNHVAGGALHVESCRITGFTSGTASGIRFAPSGDASLYVSDTVLSENGTGTSGGGIVIRPAAGLSRVQIRKVEASNNSNGIVSDGSGGASFVHVQIVDTVASGNANAGISARTLSSVFMDRVSSVLNNGPGALADGATTQILITNSTFSGNGAGLSLVNGATGYSYYTNHVNANRGPDGTPLPGTLGQY